MKTAAIIGASGFSGQETLDRALAHPDLEVVSLGSDSLAGKPALSAQLSMASLTVSFMPPMVFRILPLI